MNLVAIVLAAGSARRFGANKLAADFDGRPLVWHAIRAARAAPVRRVIVVGRPGQQPGDWPGAPPVEAIAIQSEALSTSLQAGIAAAGDADGAFVFLGDMPLVPHELAGRLAQALGGNFAAVPEQGGRPGHPVLLSRRAFAEITGLTGDQGAGGLLKARADVGTVPWDSDAIHLDVDRREDLERLQDGQGKSRSS